MCGVVVIVVCDARSLSTPPTKRARAQQKDPRSVSGGAEREKKVLSSGEMRPKNWFLYLICCTFFLRSGFFSLGPEYGATYTSNKHLLAQPYCARTHTQITGNIRNKLSVFDSRDILKQKSQTKATGQQQSHEAHRIECMKRIRLEGIRSKPAAPATEKMDLSTKYRQIWQRAAVEVCAVRFHGAFMNKSSSVDCFRGLPLVRSH